MTGITIVPFRRKHDADFRRLNLAWIEGLFKVEAPDRKVLDDPFAAIVARGGTIFFALDGEEVVGTVALIRAGDGCCELANAIRLFERPGFRHAIDPDPSDYVRADVYMELPIATDGG